MELIGGTLRRRSAVSERAARPRWPGFAVTRLGLGCVGLGSGNRRMSDDVRLVEEAIDLGVTVFDTADVYGGGASEHVLGRAVRRRRDEVVIATKGGFVFRDRRPAERWARRRVKAMMEVARSHVPAAGSPIPGSGSYTEQNFSPHHLRRAIHASLRRLRTDRIDVYQLHGPERVLPDVVDQLADLVVAGDVGRFGIGAGSVVDADPWVGVPGVSVLQVPFGVLDPEAATTTFPLARDQGVEVWVRGVFGGGLLGLADRDPAALAAHPKRPQVEAVGRIATTSGLDPFQLAAGFVRAHEPEISTVLVGTTSPEHLRRNVEAMEAQPLPAQLAEALSSLSAPTGERT